MNQAIMTKTTATELVAVYRQAVADIRHAFALVDSAEGRLHNAFGDGTRSRSTYVHDGFRSMRWGEPDEALKQLDQTVWRTLIQRLEIRRFLSVKAWDQLQKEIDGGKMPPITEENLTSLFASLTSQLEELGREAILEVYEWLRPSPRSLKLKTNKPFELERRVIIPYTVERQYCGRKFRVSYHRQQNVMALENVFNAIDGKGQVNKSYRSQLELAIEASEDGTGETELFRFRACKNRNLHLEFRRPDLVAKLNAKAGGKRLRGEREA